MKQQGLSRALIVIILILVLALAFTGVYLSGLVHFNNGIKLIGLCDVTSYVLPDTVALTFQNVTTTEGNTTTYYTSTSAIYPTVEALGSTTYTTTTYASNSSSYTITNSTDILPYSPSSTWAISVCTFAP